MTTLIRSLFRADRPIDRKIEKVIDYKATEEARLAAEIGEYEVTESVEDALRKILEPFDGAVRGGHVSEIGVWVSGFYGSGKSSLTKYLGLALDRHKKVNGVPFAELFAARINDVALRQTLKAVAARVQTHVVMLDLATDQQFESASASVAQVLYWKVLRDLGFSNDRKVAELEVRLDRDGRLAAFHDAYRRMYPGKGEWDDVHHDSTLAVPRASRLVPEFYPEYAGQHDFTNAQFAPSFTVEDTAKAIIELVHRRRGNDALLLLVDEVGQYVAPRRELILNLDGLVRAFKEQGRGKVWFVATAQQTLTEITRADALNTADLFKLKDRFPIPVELEAEDIREITCRRLLGKSPEGMRLLQELFDRHGQALSLHTRLTDFGTSSALTSADFVRTYPFLPARFELMLDLIRALARRTGGTGLRSAIRLVQDLLVDKSRVLGQGTTPVADRELGALVAADDLYDTLRHDLEKEARHAVEGVERIRRDATYGKEPLAIRVAKAVAVLQPLESRPRTVENIAALLYPRLGAASEVDSVRHWLDELVRAKDFGLVELKADAKSPLGSGYMFLSDEVLPYRKRRDAYEPTVRELDRELTGALRTLFDPAPDAKYLSAKTIGARIVWNRETVVGETGDVVIRIEFTDTRSLPGLAEDWTRQTREREATELRATAIVLVDLPDDVRPNLAEAIRSTSIVAEGGKVRDPKADVQKYLRSEERNVEQFRAAARKDLERAVQEGVLIFRGRRRAFPELGTSPSAALRTFLADSAQLIFPKFELAPKSVATDAACKLVDSERLDRVSTDVDPFKLVTKTAGSARIDPAHPALTEVLAELSRQVKAAGTGRIPGSKLQDELHEPPFGYSKDTTRLLLAALLLRGDIEVFAADGVFKTGGPRAREVFRTTATFNRAAVGLRGQKVPVDALDSASRRLETLFGIQVLPLEDQISRAVRAHIPGVVENVGPLPDRLRLLELPGVDRARRTLEAGTDLLRDDAGGAAMMLGGSDAHLHEDIAWARRVREALGDGRHPDSGEATVRQARSLIAALKDLQQLLPSLDLWAAEQGIDGPIDRIAEVLSGDAFFEHLADVRTARHAIEAMIASAVAREEAALASSLSAWQTRFESHDQWLKLDADRRRAIAGQLTPGGPAPATIATLRQRAIRHMALSGQLSPLLESLTPPKPEPVLPGPAPVVEPPEDTSTVDELPSHHLEHWLPADLPSREIRTEADVDHVVQTLDTALRRALQSGPFVLVKSS